MALILALKRHIHTGRDNQAQEALARHDLGDRRARGRARRQDAADRRPRPHRRAAGPARQGVRHARGRRPARPSRAARRRCRPRTRQAGRAAPFRGHRRPHLPAHARDHEPDRRQGARGHEALRASHQRRARARRRRGRADQRARGEAPCRRRARRHAGGAAAGRLAAVGHAERAHHAAYGRRDAALRGRRDRSAAREPRPPLARRDDAEKIRSSDTLRWARSPSARPQAARSGTMVARNDAAAPAAALRFRGRQRQATLRP